MTLSELIARDYKVGTTGLMGTVKKTTILENHPIQKEIVEIEFTNGDVHQLVPYMDNLVHP